MKIIFCGGKQAGMVALLTLIAKRIKPDVVAEDKLIKRTARNFNLNIINYESLEKTKFDLLISVGIMKIIPKNILSNGKCINFHPCLYKYKGLKPVKRLIDAGLKKASVGCHYMTEDIDGGEVILEKFIEVKGKTEPAVYNELYILYSEVLIDLLKKLKYT